VEINATIIDNILQENYLRRPPSYQFFTGALVIAIGIILSLAVARLNAVTGFLMSFAALAAYIFVNQELFNRGTWYNLTYPSLQIFGVYLSITAYNYFSESKQKSFIRGAFGQFLSPTVVKQLVDNPDQLKLGGDQVRMTGFFSDVAGFSTISETLTPKQLVELLNEYLTAMTDIVLKYEGTIDKYEGDAIIAFWGAPIKHSDHALRACRASLAMQKKLIDMRKVWKEQGRAEMQVRIGLNTGLMVVGNMGSASRMDYTMMGDAVNLASRLEGVNKVYGTQTMVSQFTYEDVKDQLEFRELDKIRVMGKNEPVSIYEVLTEKGSLTPEQKEGFALFAKGLENYRGQLWEEAIEVFQNVQKLIPDDPPCNAFIERCRTYIKSRELSRRAEDKARVPPDDWDGVYQMTSK
jgi:adenylate cyclase